jgi:hypothetical protein
MRAPNRVSLCPLSPVSLPTLKSPLGNFLASLLGLERHYSELKQQKVVEAEMSIGDCQSAASGVFGRASHRLLAIETLLFVIVRFSVDQ